MEDRKRTILAVAIVAVVLAAVLYSFFLNLFLGTPELIVADPNASENTDSSGSQPVDEVGIPVEVTPHTVQSVVASLDRYESYSRTVTVEYFDGDGRSLGVSSAQVWADGGWVRSSVTLSSGTVEHSIVGAGTLWLWYDEGESLYSGPAAEMTADLMQRLPTYEDVLALDKDSITGADFVSLDGQPCIYVEAVLPGLGYVERYWISEVSGLLLAAETQSNGTVVYSMASNGVVSPMERVSGTFVLPDGTVLYVPAT